VAVAALLAEGADVNAVTGTGRYTPLHQANSASVVKLLLRAGADPQAKDKFGKTPLAKALQDGRCDVAAVLLNGTSDAAARDAHGRTLLHSAAMGGCTQLGAQLIKSGADVNARDTYAGNSVLYLALTRGDAAFVELLRKAGAPLDAGYKNTLGLNLLHGAALGGMVDIAGKLLQAGVPAGSTDKRGFTPLAFALQCGHERVAQLLLTSGAKLDISYRDGNKHTLLNSAAAGGCTKVIRELLAAGASPNVLGGYGNTPLHDAAAFARVEAACILLESGAKAEAIDKSGSTALHHLLLFHRRDNLAARKELLALLLKAGVGIDVRGYAGRTALHMAIDRGFRDIALTLVDAGARCDYKNDAGQTALDLAIERQDRELVTVLRNAAREAPESAD